MANKSVLASLQRASVVYRTENGQGRQVWADVTLDIRQGDWLVVTGPNGSGKSTLASVLLGLCPLTAGQLVRDVGRFRGVLQSPDAQCIGDTVEEELNDIPGAMELTAEERALFYQEALLAVGLNVALNRTLHTLSGGQKQLLNLACALASRPAVLVLDEPTAMLDPASRIEVIQAVRRAHQQGTSIVWITHRLEEAAEANRIVAFGGGRVAFEGTPEAFFYGRDGEQAEGSSPCVELGLEPPFVVQTAWELLARGVQLRCYPLDADQLAEAVTPG
ncbi:ATP-binding cassette domain-containing protein [Paenibacillus aestuarii]|uniref:ATP-binding cassette domain-containing protein n=1 Tax=Paenibacillus aestuarii TaxID=516965 RepID=A0ABW0K1K4_9BACL|nr:ATP-binding cassette domain-containing protein [Paenibacillus aestuarii]